MPNQKKSKRNKAPVEVWIVDPIKRFINNSTMSGIILFSSAFLALLLSNSPWHEEFHHLWEIEFSIRFGNFDITKNLHHWINDGLMAVFFFVVGLELKREIVAGELSSPKNAVLPIAAAIGGMFFPAVIYLLFNPEGDPHSGWGIPMATDIAFALGVLYLLGDRVPISLKIFLTALAIADDIGAVLVIALFYTSDINFLSLLTGAGFLTILLLANITGVRNTLFYAIIGIGGLWLAFLMSGVHATIAAVLAAFTIPVRVKVDEATFTEELSYLLEKFKEARPNNVPTVTDEQLHILEEIRDASKNALTPLQRLEHALHPVVAFIILPIFALSNGGITFTREVLTQLGSPVMLGVFFGLLLGKVIGVVGTVYTITKLKLVSLPTGMKFRHVWGAGFLAAIGFTMSLFISGLAFKDPDYIIQSKVGILSASIIASFIGYFIIRSAASK
ncbi:MAG: Na+/H+ antiporter NhaA [Sphingobacteriales bacterium]|nr:MAG: Na+/H+ antiporter NhaA [Sphingobacteriales bacterium]